MLHRIVIFGMCILLASILFGQKLSKEEEAVKAAIMQGGTAYSACDYEKWAEIVVQDDRYFGLWGDPYMFVIWNNWKEADDYAKDYFHKYSPYLGPIELTDWKFVISGDMAFVRCKQGPTPQARVLLKEKGKWREVFFCQVDAGAYQLQQLLGSVEQLCGEWAYIVGSYHAEPEIKFPINSGNLTVQHDRLTFEITENLQFDDGQAAFNFKHAWDEAKGVMRTQAAGRNSTNNAWVGHGTTEIVDSGLITKIFEKEGADKPAWSYELTLTSPNVLVEKWTNFDKEGKQTQVQTVEWQRK